MRDMPTDDLVRYTVDSSLLVYDQPDGDYSEWIECETRELSDDDNLIPLPLAFPSVYTFTIDRGNHHHLSIYLKKAIHRDRLTIQDILQACESVDPIHIKEYNNGKLFIIDPPVFRVSMSVDIYYLEYVPL